MLISRWKSSLLTKKKQSPEENLLEWERLSCGFFRAVISSFMFTIVSPGYNRRFGSISIGGMAN